jgi:Tol biopolymer transport system component
MGEVYKAEDTRLDRTVAIKVLPGHLGENEELRQRLDREAKTISSLNHPHICALYDVGHENGVDYLVMEYLEGETLADRLGRDKLPREEVVDLGLQISGALDKAHRGGVIHRDLKPGNIMLTRNGVKLLDFGLAKMAVPPVDPVSSSLTSMHTEQYDASKPLTERGTILGTFQYMSPEQLEGHEADARSDIFALGAVLYEMATGKKAFEGKSQASLIAAILEREPAAVSTIEPMSPPALDHLVGACLAKDPDERVQTAHDVQLQLKWIKEGGSQVGIPTPVAAHRRRTNRIAWALVVVLAVVCATLARTMFLQVQPPARTIHANIIPPEGATFAVFGTTMLAISPDGTKVAFAAAEGENRMLWVRPLGSSSAQPLRGTNGAAWPFWSPDSRFVCFFANGKLRKIDVAGGAPITVCNAPTGRGGSWGSQDVIVFAPGRSSGLQRVPASGGEPVTAMEPDSTLGEMSMRWPHFLPNGEHFLYTSQQTEDAVYVGSLDGSLRKRLLDVNTTTAYTNGHMLYVRDNVLMAQPFDLGRLELTGDGFSVADPVMRSDSWSRAGFTVSDNGLLMYLEDAGSVGTALAWYERDGRPLDTVETPTFVDDIVLSRDDKMLAIALAGEQGGIDVWTYDLGRELLSRLTFAEDVDDPVFSPDGQYVVYALAGDLYVKRASGAGEERLLLKTNDDKVTCEWSPDGKLVVYMDNTGETLEDLWAVPSDGSGKPFAILKTPFRDMMGQISPDGRWITYVSNESGDLHVYVQNFPELTGKWQISREPATMPRWRGDGKELFFVSMKRELKAVTIDGSGSSLQVGDVETLFDTKIRSSMATRTHQWVVSSDGQRFLVAEAPASAAGWAATARLVINWLGE